MDHPNLQRLRAFYEAFNRRDAAAMAELYAADASFSDPAFPGLTGAEVPAMWASLCSSATDLRVELMAATADETSGTAHWEAWYAFGPGKRPVHNVIHGTFTFRDGKVVAHTDGFDFWVWSRQALGAPGWLLGWSGFLRGKVQAQARQRLRGWMEKHPA